MKGFTQNLRCGAAAALLASLALCLFACASLPPAIVTAAERPVKVATAEGTADAILLVPATRRKAPGVILWGDLAGLRPATVALGRKLAAEGFVVLVPNAFYRSVALNGTTASTLDQPTRNKEWRGTANDGAIMSDAKAYLAYLDQTELVDPATKVGVVGYEIGAVHAFLTARAAPGRIGAVSAIHPLAVATARPNSPHLFVGQSQAAYYVAFGKDADDREPGDKVDLRKAFADAGLQATVEVLAGNNGFGLSDSPAYDAASSEHSSAATIALLRRSLK